jgi:hypothetical protein
LAFGVSVARFLLKQQIHFLIHTVLNTLAHSLASFIIAQQKYLTNITTSAILTTTQPITTMTTLTTTTTKTPPLS